MPCQLVNLKKQLQWSDFGSPRNEPAPAPGQTGTAAHTWTNYNFTGDVEPIPGTSPARFRLQDNCVVTIFLQRPRSWVARWLFSRPVAFQRQVLHHEQGHYQLVALLIRDMFLELMALKSVSLNRAQDVATRVTQIRSSYGSKFEAINERYDTDTNSGQNAAQQARWDGFIHKAFTEERSPRILTPDGVAYKTPILTVLSQAGINL